MIIDPIPLSGPSITHREIECAADAAAVGWNAKAANYINAFQRQVANAAGQRYAFATSSRAGALHIALLALGVGPGDEVLVPEIADISAAACVTWTGAKPVFCDVDPATLCLSPLSAAGNISSRTKGMIAVHLYGQPCQMVPLTELAASRSLFLVEDATQGLGNLYHGRPAGSFGIFSVFSFAGEEVVTCGEGGMLLGSNQALMDKAAKLGSMGRSPDNPFIYNAVGYNYAMSNLQAAIGVAQMERLDELLDKKRRIFEWYQERLGNVPGVGLNVPLSGCRGSYLMTTLGFSDASILRHDFLKKLLASRVVCKPVYYPLSSMPMFAKADNAVAYGAGVRAIVLPSGHNRTEEEVEYVSSVIKTLLADRCAKSALATPTGWLKYKSDVLEFLAEIKIYGLCLPFIHNEEEFSLQALTVEDSKNPETIAFLTAFRRDNMHAFLRHFEITEDHVRSTMEHYLELARDFILFFVIRNGERLGHIGLDDFSFQDHECVVEGLMMRSDAGPGVAAAASETLYEWAGKALGIKRVYNHVVGGNTRVRLLASAQGFKEINRTALYRQKVADGVVFRPMYIQGHDKPDEYFVFSVKDLA